MGNLVSDPETKSIGKDSNMLVMTVATNKSWLDKNGEVSKKTEFHRVTVWKKLAEICDKYLKKGSPVYLEGSLQNRSYEDPSGIKKYITEIIANDVHILKYSSSEA